MPDIDDVCVRFEESIQKKGSQLVSGQSNARGLALKHVLPDISY